MSRGLCSGNKTIPVTNFALGASTMIRERKGTNCKACIGDVE
jgi:hypothetical protein